MSRIGRSLICTAALLPPAMLAAAPPVLEAHGSYGMAMTPRFRTAILPFLDRGGVYVLANVRGGGEFGRDWHYAGKAETKANTCATRSTWPRIWFAHGSPRPGTFHSAKYAAKLQAASISGEPVLLRIDFDAGHGMGSSRSQTDAQWADMLSFVLWQVGVPEFQPAR